MNGSNQPNLFLKTLPSRPLKPNMDVWNWCENYHTSCWVKKISNKQQWGKAKIKIFAKCTRVLVTSCRVMKSFLFVCMVQFTYNSTMLQKLNSLRTATRVFRLCQVSLQDQYQNFMVRLMRSISPFQGWLLVCFPSNTVFLTIYNSLLYSLHTHKIWKRSVEKYKCYGSLSTTIHFPSMFCEVGVVEQCTEEQEEASKMG